MEYEEFSIRCPRCLAWSVNEGSYCHKCGRYLRSNLPQDEIRDIVCRLAGSLKDALEDLLRVTQ